MKTSRRGFLGFLGGSAIAAAQVSSVLDPELALWVPGAKTISIPNAPVIISPEAVKILPAPAAEVLIPSIELLGVVESLRDGKAGQLQHTFFLGSKLLDVKLKSEYRYVTVENGRLVFH